MNLGPSQSMHRMRAAPCQSTRCSALEAACCIAALLPALIGDLTSEVIRQQILQVSRGGFPAAFAQLYLVQQGHHGTGPPAQGRFIEFVPPSASSEAIAVEVQKARNLRFPAS